MSSIALLLSYGTIAAPPAARTNWSELNPPGGLDIWDNLNSGPVLRAGIFQPYVAPTAPAFVFKSGLVNNSATTIAYTWTTAPVVGNTIVVMGCGWAGGGGPSISSVSDGSNTYSFYNGLGGNASRVWIAWARVATVPTTTTVTLDGTADMSASFSTFSGIANPAVDVAAASGQGTAPTSPFNVGPTAALAQASELILTVVGGNGGATAGIGVPSGYTLLDVAQSNAFINMGCAYKVVNSTAAVSAGWTFTTWGNEIEAAIQTLKGT